MTNPDELKQLVEDAAKLFGLRFVETIAGDVFERADGSRVKFNPCDPERGDLMKVVEAVDLVVGNGAVYSDFATKYYTKGNHASLVLAILRAASAVYKSRGGV